MSGVSMRQRFLEDKESMESDLALLSPHADIWQNRIVWHLCKAVFDLLEYTLLRMK